MNMTTLSLPEHAVRRCQRMLNSLHSTAYFTADFADALAARGITDPAAAHLTAKTAALGAVGPGTASAALGGIGHGLLARHLPHVWERITPAEVLELRFAAADSTLRRLLGDDTLASPEMAEAARLALRATGACVPQGRPMYAALADVKEPQPAHLALWYAATLLREYRGDGHLCVLVGAGVAGLDALVLHAATGEGVPKDAVIAGQGWSEREWEEAESRLRARGLLDPENQLTEQGRKLREDLEDETDRLDAAPFEHLGGEGVARLTELTESFVRAAADAGAYPAHLRQLFLPV
ncbi:hypothetical protein ABR738_17445 [Streptomyces sp. Edi4]|uniref:SCO6745 family protein n=1 Tax=Streptomyces sp. Edi4 TaxID=3162527 RepID=UPI003306523C